MKLRVKILFVIFLFSSLSSLYAFKIEGLQLDAGLFWMRNEVYDTAPGDRGMDTLVFALGCTVPLELGKYLTLNPSFFIHFNTYQLIEERDLAMPVDPANAHSFYVSGIFLNIPIGFRIPYQRLSFGAQAGPAFRFMIPLYGEVEDDRSGLAAAFYNEGRFLYLSAGAWLDFRFTKSLSLNVRGEYYFPLYNSWIDDDLPFSEGMAVYANIGIRYYFKNTPKEKSQQNPSDVETPDDSE